MQQIADWLEKLGMSEYAQGFAENHIDFSILRDLTDEDLKEVGVVLGDRRKMLRAIADIDGIEKNASANRAKINVCETPRRTPVASEPISTATPVSATAEVSGERRYVTVMFCDLVGSTGIAAQLDAEEWRDLVCAYLDAACGAVTEMGGHVARKMGDGLMFLFGYPLAQENDAERAARAALSIQRAIAEVNRKNTGKPALSARIGIETGAVVVDAAGEIYGDAPNIAARVEAVAEPGTVVMTAQVLHQVAGLFVVEERGSYELKGVPKPVTLYRLVRASGGGRHASQRHLTPLVGRDEEVAMLMRRWEKAQQGDGQLVMIVGEPGLGKSRLIEEFRLRLREVPHTWVEYSCSQLLQNSPLHPIADWGRQRFGGADTPAEQRLADLEHTLELVKLDPAENAPLLAPLLDIPLPQDRAPILEPEVLRRRQLTALTNWSMASARTQPAVLTFEDAHWADPTTLDFLRGMAECGGHLFVLIAARPEFRPPWGGRSHHSTIYLPPLDRSQVRQMVGGLVARHALPTKVVDGVTQRSGGVPLFVEEVTRLLLERGEHADTIPPTLQQSLAARLDRLGPAREVAQIGAVIGRDFSYSLLRTVAGIEDGPLQAALERLAEADILLVRGLPPESEYRFKHVLIQDAAYEKLLKSRRRVLHCRVGEALRDSTAVPELLAHHFTAAGLTKAAIEWWGKAGQRSLERSALVEAIEQFTRALDQIAGLPGTPALRREQIRLQVALITPLIHVRGYAAPETRAAAEQAHALIQQAEMLGEHPEDPLLLFSVLFSFWVQNYAAFDGKAMRELARQFLALADKSPSTAPLMTATRLTGISLMTTGDIAGSVPHFNRTLKFYNPAEHRSLATRFAIDAAVSALCFRSWSFWLLGYPDAALADAEDGLRNARELGQAATLMWALFYGFHPSIWCGKYAGARLQADELAVLANEKGTPFWKANGIRAQGYLLAEAGGAADAISMIRSGLDAWRSTGSTLRVPTDLSYLASAYLEVGEFEDAERCIQEAMTAVETTDERWYEAEVNRIAGEVALRSPDSDKSNAERYFEDALTIAREQQAKSWELRAAMSLARLWRSQGKPQQARELLAPVYDWFTEGFDTRDLKDAQALLADLAA